MIPDKPKLTASEQIEHLKEKGVRFTIMSEEEALQYLKLNNNYFKLTAYRKNYTKDSSGRYIGLEFAYLRDIAVIDMKMRYCLLAMCLDIEHHVRVSIMRIIEESDEDGYSIVLDYKERNPDKFDQCVKRAQNSPYCRDIAVKYNQQMPVWAFIEISQFGCLVDFYKFVADRFADKKMQNEYYILQEIRKIRNACAHSNCVLNDLTSKEKSNYKPSRELCNALGIIGISKGVRDRRLSNDRIRQIATLLFFYKGFIQSEELKKSRAEDIRQVFLERAFKNIKYYHGCTPVLNSFEFFKQLIDKWYPLQ